MKKLVFRHSRNTCTSQFLRKMKLTVLFLFSTVLLCLSAETYPQMTKLSVVKENTTLLDVIRSIEEQSEFDFFYNEKVDVSRVLSVDLTDKKIFEVLDNVLANTSVKYKVLGKQIALYDKLMMEPFLPEVIQELRVSGKVTDATTRGAMPGVNIAVRGTSLGTITDIDGRYSLTVPDRNAVLVFSFIGYVSQEIPLNGKPLLDVALVSEIKGLDEVVVIGYGTQKKVNLTGSVSSVSSEELNKRPVINPVLMLQGKTPGVQITQHSGQPGNESANILIRGFRSFGTNNQPLVLVDGIQSSLTILDPRMIESISVLKDASSSAIYGSRAANGVILVTTKRGSSNQLNIEFHTIYSIENPTFIPEFINNSAENMIMVNEARVNSRGPGAEVYTQEEINSYKNNVGDPMYPNTDWNKFLYRTGSTISNFLSMNGGTMTTRFNFGLSYVDQIGVINYFDAKKINLLFNLSSELNKIVSFNVNFNFNQNKRSEVQGGALNYIGTAWSCAPLYGPRIIKEGPSMGMYTRFAFAKASANWHPVILGEQGGDAYQDNNGIVSAGINVKFMEGLNWETTGSARLLLNNFKSTGFSVPTYNWFSGEYVTTLRAASVGIDVSRRDTKETLYTLFSTLKYNKLFAEKHLITGLFGYSQENLRNDYLYGYRKLMPNPDITELNSGSSEGQSTGGSAYEWAIQSLFGRINYVYDEKYLFEASFRYDGSSRFSKGNKWGFFPSMSAGWRIDQEDFMSNISWINALKLRASYGLLGSQEIGSYPYQEMISIGWEYAWDTSVQSGAYVGRLNNYNITWEKTNITDFGIDFSLFNEKFYGTFDYFNKVTKDILRGGQVAGFVGLSAPTINEGEMKNEGFEFLVGHRNIIGDFTYDVSFNLSSYKNTLTKFGAREIIAQRWDYGYYINEEGSPWNSLYAWKCIGVFQSQEEIDAAPAHQFNPKPGDLRYEDVNNDDKIDQDDRVVIPGAFPKFEYGGNLSVKWKNIELSAFFSGSEGKKYAVHYWGISPVIQDGKSAAFWRNRWTPENPSTTLPRLYLEGEHPAITTFSTWWIHDASYFRLKNLNIGYDLPKKLCNRIGSKGIRIYYSGDNLFLITQFYKSISGVKADPERVSSSGSQRFNVYPQLTIHSFGAKLNF